MTGNCTDQHLSSAASIVLSVWFSLSGVAAVTGNVVVLWLFYKNESLRTISNRFLASLSVGDAFVGLVIDPVWIAIRCWIQPPPPSPLSEIRFALWVHTTAATALNSCCVSIDRFIAIQFPFRYQDILSKRRCLVVIILVWFISLSLPLLITFKKKDRRELFVSFACITFVVPLLVVSFCYIFTFKLARKQFRSILAVKKLPDSDKNIKVRAMQNFKAIKTVALVLGACIITWIPSVVLQLVKFYNREAKRDCNVRQINLIVQPWVEAVALTSSAVNPLMYYFRNSEFRRAFRRTFRWLPYVHEQNASDHNAQPEGNRMV